MMATPIASTATTTCRHQDTAVGLPITILLVLIAFLTLGALSVDRGPAATGPAIATRPTATTIVATAVPR